MEVRTGSIMMGDTTPQQGERKNSTRMYISKSESMVGNNCFGVLLHKSRANFQKTTKQHETLTSFKSWLESQLFRADFITISIFEEY